MRYDYNVKPHCHARCRRCGRVSDVEAEGIPAGGITAKAYDGFFVEGYAVEFYGICKECSEEEIS